MDGSHSFLKNARKAMYEAAFHVPPPSSFEELDSEEGEGEDQERSNPFLELILSMFSFDANQRPSLLELLHSAAFELLDITSEYWDKDSSSKAQPFFL